MNVLLLGATGMVGQGVLRECLRDARVSTVLTVGRSATGQQHHRLREIVPTNLFDLTAFEDELTGFDACFFSLGVSSVGLSEQQYTHITFDLALSIAQTLLRLNPGLTFVFVSGTGTDSTEHGRVMWARVKGRTENELLRMPFKAAYMLRPALIVPLHGIRSKTRLYSIFYTLAAPALPLLRKLLPDYVTTTEELGKAMIDLAASGGQSRILENRDITGR